tara:strand:+ start:169 stop:321 length:153 start_codon:yes stop_codon:yes gene_type:complete
MAAKTSLAQKNRLQNLLQRPAGIENPTRSWGAFGAKVDCDLTILGYFLYI